MSEPQEPRGADLGAADSAAAPSPARPAPGEPLTFPAVARLELDELLEQLVDRAHEVLRTQSRLQGLLRATGAIGTDLDLRHLLQRIVEEARALIGARTPHSAWSARTGPGPSSCTPAWTRRRWPGSGTCPPAAASWGS